MTCSEAREALSAWYDGEGPAPTPGLRAHVAECDDCAAYEHSLETLGQLVARHEIAATRVPDLAPGVVRRAARPRAVVDRSLQWAVGLAGLVELATTAYFFLHGDGDAHAEAHESHEAVALTLGLCMALLYAAFRPRLSSAYVPVLGVATLLMVVASVHDVGDHVVGLDHELRHTGLVVGFLLLCLTAARQPRDPLRAHGRLLVRRLLGRHPDRRPRLRVVHRWTRIAGATLLAGALVLVAGPAEAHAVLEQSDPAPHAVLDQAPATVVLTFDEPVTLLPTSVTVIGPDGSRVDTGAAAHDGGRDDTAAVALDHPTQRGTYLVSWRVVSADSHPVSGAYTFSVGTAGATPSAPSTSGDRGVGIGLGVSRWLGYAGSALLVGGLLFVVLCRPRPAPAIRHLLLGGAGALALGAVGGLLLKGPYDAGLGAGRILDGALLREVLGTTYGGATLARLILAIVLGALVAGRVRGRSLPARIVLVPALAVPVTFALAGHPVAADPAWVAVVVDSVHVLAMSAWLGGLVLLLTVVLRRDDDALAITRRFSAVALAGVVALALTGGVQAWRETRSLAALQHTTYGRELIVKLVLVAVLLAAAASSRSLVWRHVDLAELRRTVTLEVVGVAVVLGITSALVATQPARAAYRPSVDASLTVLGDTVQVSAIPDGDRSMELHLYVFGPSGRPTEPAELSAAVAKGDLGPLPVRLANAGPGHRQGAVDVPVTGDWTLAVTLRTTAVDEDTATVTLPIR